MNQKMGHIHPINLIINKAASIFQKIGFRVVTGPELETEWYNFDALNVPKDHPARDMQDTFWIDTKDGSRKVMRTHTSNMQIRSMEEWVKNNKEKMDKGENVEPLAIIAPGKVYRNEATDARHEANFYQLECLYVDKKENVSVANLKWTIETYLSGLFDKKIQVRLRSSYFPFVEPALEVDMSCFLCNESGKVVKDGVEKNCPICSGTGFIEIMGSGMVHPNTLSMCGVDPKKYSGFAFGGGIDRVAMLLYGIEDIRHLYNGDIRFTSQF
jgi:phenylalanyl-tRNA synthetase alpha chain